MKYIFKDYLLIFTSIIFLLKVKIFNLHEEENKTEENRNEIKCQVQYNE